MDLSARQDVPESYTILRIKRKRNEEPLDALVVESRTRRKKSKGGLSVFQFAETVEQNAWEDERQKEDLESRISSLVKSTTKKEIQSAPQPPTSTQASTSNNDPVPEAPVKKPAPTKPLAEEPTKQYTIVPREPELSPKSSRLRPTAPPKVHSYKDLVQKSKFKMYDAIPATSALAGGAQSPGAMDAEIEKFLPMLQDYLKVSGDDLASTPNTTVDDDSDYVWDVFYSRPITNGELYGPNSNIGKVTGLPDDDLYASDSDSEYEDEDDEDSNAEDWYTNDYPDEESDSDFGGGSEGSDAFHDNSDSEDVAHEERGSALWNYR